MPKLLITFLSVFIFHINTVIIFTLYTINESGMSTPHHYNILSANYIQNGKHKFKYKLTFKLVSKLEICINI
jgi:hypothetical protein